MFDKSSPYSLAIHTTLSTGQPYYVIESSTVGVECKIGDEVEARCAAESELNCKLVVKKEHRYVCGDVCDIYETDCKKLTGCEVEAKSENRTEMELILESNRALDVAVEEKREMEIKMVASEQYLWESRVDSSTMEGVKAKVENVLVDNVRKLGTKVVKSGDEKDDTLVKFTKFDSSHDWGDSFMCSLKQNTPELVFRNNNTSVGDDKNVLTLKEGEGYEKPNEGAVYIPDFLNPKTVSWWGDEIKRFHELVPVDGLWIDMNEASNFCSGLCTIPEGKKCPSVTGPGWDCCLDCTNITDTRWDNPPCKINASGMEEAIGFKTIATSATHYNGVLEYDARSLYGFSQAIATHKALKELEGKHLFILTRSTFVGFGHYAAHWTGDNKGTWEDLRYSISTILNFDIFGVPMEGSDICGFYPAPIEELCNRWIAVGAFYPFSRDHANYYSPRQELYQWESVAESARNALGMRYKLLPYLYNTYEAHISGAPIARPFFFSFPQYTVCYNMSTQFLAGSSLMVSPVVEANKTKVDALFPPGTWYNMFDMTQAIVLEKGQYVSLDAPLHVINVHVYQNTIIPMQQGGTISKEARTTPYSFVVTFPAGVTEGKATGHLFVDEDEPPEMKLGNDFSTHVDFYATVSQGKVKVWSDVQEPKFASDKGWIIEKVTVLVVRGVGGTFSVKVDDAANDDYKGTLGYLDPEYYRNYRLTDKSDVYSFGVVLLELLTSQKAIDFNRPSDDVNLAVYVQRVVEEERLMDAADPMLKEGASELEFETMKALGFLADDIVAFGLDKKSDSTTKKNLQTFDPGGCIILTSLRTMMFLRGRNCNELDIIGPSRLVAMTNWIIHYFTNLEITSPCHVKPKGA